MSISRGKKSVQRDTYEIQATEAFKIYWGAVVEDVRTVFERINDATIYIPDLQPMVA